MHLVNGDTQPQPLFNNVNLWHVKCCSGGHVMNDNADRYALAKVVAKIKEDVCDNGATDVYALAKDLQKHLPSLPHSDLIKLIENTVATIGGAALWEKRGERD